MSQTQHRAKVLVAALTVLLTGGFVGSTGLVFCVGTNGHRALEIEHPGMECPTLAGPQGASEVSVRPSPKCLDVPTVGTGPTVLQSVDPGQLPSVPLTFLAANPEPAHLIQTRVPPCADARATPLHLARHLRSTILLV